LGVTVEEYLTELVAGMREIMTAVDEMVRREPDEDTLNAIGREGIERWEAMLTRLQPPPELEALHERLWAIAKGPPDDQGMNDVFRELARRADAEGLELLPGASMEEIEASVGDGPQESFILLEGDAGNGDEWEAKLRRALEEAGHQDVEEVIERVRRIGEEE
jgi:hypothetical protein